MLHIRPARPEDHPHFVRLFPELGVDDPIPDAESWWQKQGSTTLIAELDGAVRGYLFYDLPLSTLYVRNVVSDPGSRRRGIGRALLEAAISRARDAGVTRWCLNVKPENVAARTLYESMGLRLAFETAVMRIPWSAAASLPRSSFEVRTPSPEEDARIESAVKLHSGQLQQQRSRPGLVLLTAFTPEGEPVGLAAFNPKFPGAFPFRALSLEAAGALIATMSEHRIPLPEGDWRASQVQLVIEGDPTLAEGLRHAGAYLALPILHLDGPLP